MGAMLRTLSLLLVFLACPTVRAAPLCLPGPVAIPGEIGAPDWWNVISGRRDDPRWCGAMGVGHDANRGRFQAIQANNSGTDYLYLSWEIRGDGGGGAQDLLYFGFLDPGSNTGTAFRLTIPTDTGVGTVAKQVVDAGQVQWRAKLASGVAWGAWAVSDPTTAPWMQSTGRYWVDCSAACSTYTVMVRVPIDTNATPNDFDLGLNIPSSFLLWYDIQVLQPGAPPTTDHHTLPEGHPFSVANFGNPAYPSSSQWAEVQLAGGGCEAGVSLDPTGVHLTHGGSPPDHSITTDNTLHAAPDNGSGGAMDGDAVTARFRLANWGTAGPGDGQTWDDVPGCGAATGSGSIANGATFDLSCDWTPSMASLCDYRPAGVPGTLPPWDVCAGPGSLSPDQWLLAELSAGSVSTGDIFFPSASACRSVDILGGAISVPTSTTNGRIYLVLCLLSVAMAALAYSRARLV